jgi:hypothetical protein
MLLLKIDSSYTAILVMYVALLLRQQKSISTFRDRKSLQLGMS